MKILFLDIDGVLNGWNTKERIGGYIFIDEERILRLKEIIDKTGAKIVLSSSWRMCNDPTSQLYILYTGLVDKLKEYDLELYDTTPSSTYGYRGTEIRDWFKLQNIDDIESFVILDDDNDLKPYGRRHVQTSPVNGLSDKNVKQAIKMLNEECKPWIEDKDYAETYHSFYRQV